MLHLLPRAFTSRPWDSRWIWKGLRLAPMRRRDRLSSARPVQALSGRSDTTEVENRTALAAAYRLGASACAEVIFRASWLEPMFVRASRRWWKAPALGRFIRSVAYRLADRLFETGRGIRTISIGGASFRVDVGEWTTSGLYFANVVYEPATVQYLVDHLRPGGVFVDIGANSGYFTLLAAARVGEAGRVVAFEPNPAVRMRLLSSVERNNVHRRVRVESCALGDRSADRVPLYVPEHDGFATLMPEQTHAHSYVAGAAAIDVTVRTFDEWITDAAIDEVSLVKIDVEGAEPQVLAGMRKTLAAGRIARIVLETAWNSAAHRLLIDHGYQPTRLESVGPVDNIAYVSPRLIRRRAEDVQGCLIFPGMPALRRTSA